MSDFTTDYVCLDCGKAFEDDSPYLLTCPKCHSTDVITAEQAEENERINKREEDAEQWVLDRRLRKGE